MKVINASDFRKKQAAIFDAVNQNHTPIMVTRRDGEPVVVMSLKDFHSYDETAYLMDNPKNAKRLKEAVRNIQQGKVEFHDIIEV